MVKRKSSYRKSQKAREDAELVKEYHHWIG
jgi:hypothetical protein